MKKIILLTAVVAVLLSACSAKTPKTAAQLPQAAYLIDEEVIDEACNALEKVSCFLKVTPRK